MSSLMEETYHYVTSTRWKCCLRCYYWNQIIHRNPLGLRIQDWEFKNWIKSKLVNKRILEISSTACLFLWWQELIIVVKNCLHLHTYFMLWLLDLLDCFIRLIIRLLYSPPPTHLYFLPSLFEFFFFYIQGIIKNLLYRVLGIVCSKIIDL